MQQKGKYITSMLFFPFVNLKFRFWASPSFLSNDFSAAEHPSWMRMTPQCRGQWYLMLLHSDGVCGAHRMTIRSSKSLIVPWYTLRSSFFSRLRKAECVRKSRQYVSEICSRRAGVSSGVVEKNTCSCRAMEMCQPPLIRRTLHIQLVTPWWNFLNPSLPPSSTFLLAAVSLARPTIKVSMTRHACVGVKEKRQKCCKK